jgi:hypothetical protein
MVGKAVAPGKIATNKPFRYLVSGRIAWPIGQAMLFLVRFAIFTRKCSSLEARLLFKKSKVCYDRHVKKWRSGV